MLKRWEEGSFLSKWVRAAVEVTMFFTEDSGRFHACDWQIQIWVREWEDIRVIR
jgi:hypothetical protein